MKSFFYGMVLMCPFAYASAMDACSDFLSAQLDTIAETISLNRLARAGRVDVAEITSSRRGPLARLEAKKNKVSGHLTFLRAPAPQLEPVDRRELIEKTVRVAGSLEVFSETLGPVNMHAAVAAGDFAIYMLGGHSLESHAPRGTVAPQIGGFWIFPFDYTAVVLMRLEPCIVPERVYRLQYPGTVAGERNWHNEWVDLLYDLINADIHDLRGRQNRP